jgi:hypothetical protein
MRGWGSFEIEGQTYPFAAPEEAIDFFVDYVHAAIARATEHQESLSQARIG